MPLLLVVVFATGDDDDKSPIFFLSQLLLLSRLLSKPLLLALSPPILVDLAGDPVLGLPLYRLVAYDDDFGEFTSFGICETKHADWCCSGLLVGWMAEMGEEATPITTASAAAALPICCFTESTWNFLTSALTLGGVSDGALRSTFGVVGASGKRTSVLEWLLLLVMLEQLLMLMLLLLLLLLWLCTWLKTNEFSLSLLEAPSSDWSSSNDWIEL